MCYLHTLCTDTFYSSKAQSDLSRQNSGHKNVFYDGNIVHFEMSKTVE